MTNEIQTALVGLAVAALVAIAGVVAVLGRRVAQYVDKMFDAKERELTRQAGLDAALFAEETGRKAGKTGPEKMLIARQRMASIRPQVPPLEQEAAIVTGVAAIRASIPNADALQSVPVTVVSSVPPGSGMTPLPPPAKVPR